jgi:hypothetical protein
LPDTQVNSINDNRGRNVFVHAPAAPFARIRVNSPPAEPLCRNVSLSSCHTMSV